MCDSIPQSLVDCQGTLVDAGIGKLLFHQFTPSKPHSLAQSRIFDQLLERIGEGPGIIDRVEITEPGGSSTRIVFRNVEINYVLDSKVFDEP